MRQFIKTNKRKILKFIWFIIIPLILSFIILYPFKVKEIQPFQNQMALVSGKEYFMELDSSFLQTQTATLLQTLLKMEFLFDKYDFVVRDSSWFNDTEIARYSANVTINNKSKVVNYQKSAVFYGLSKNENLSASYRPDMVIIAKYPSVGFEGKFGTKFFVRNSISQFIGKVVLFISGWYVLWETIIKLIKYIFKKLNITGP